jgi:hypothetical protein
VLIFPRCSSRTDDTTQQQPLPTEGTDDKDSARADSKAHLPEADEQPTERGTIQDSPLSNSTVT